MAQVYNLPVTRAFTNLGKIGVGFQLFFFKTSTTTKKSVFAEAALTTPLTNPVIADANGYFPQIFMEGTGNDYKAVLADATDTDPPTSPIFTADPVEVDANDINAFGTRPAQHWGTTTNTAEAYEISPKTALSAYTDDLLFSLEIHLDSTGAGTLAVEDLNDLGNFLTALSIKKYDGTGAKVDIEVGDLQAGQTYLFRIDSVDAVVLNPEKPFFDSRNLSSATETVKGVVLLLFPKAITVANSSDTAHDIDFTAGNFIFSDGSGQAVVAALTKRFDATFALGDNVGGMAEGISLPTNGTVHLFALSTSDGSLTDYIGDTNINATNALADSVAVSNSLTKFKRITSLRTDGSANIRTGSYDFNNDGSYQFMYQSVVTDFNAVAGTIKINRLLSIPLGIRTRPVFYMVTNGCNQTNIFSYNDNDRTPNSDDNMMDDAGTRKPDIFNDFISDTSSNISTRSVSNGTMRIYLKGWIDPNLN